MINNNVRILKKPHANLQTITKALVKFQKDWPKTVGGVEGTRYLLKIRNHAPRTTESRKQCPSAFLRKGGGQIKIPSAQKPGACGNEYLLFFCCPRGLQKTGEPGEMRLGSFCNKSDENSFFAQILIARSGYYS